MNPTYLPNSLISLTETALKISVWSTIPGHAARGTEGNHGNRSPEADSNVDLPGPKQEC
jgi:hypothetical protein